MAIISFQHKFIFVKTRKTASTSIEIHLAAFCGHKDIITTIYPPHSGHFPQNFQSEGGFIYFNHMSASVILNRLPDAFSTSFKFCFERHPVDKCLSHFSMQKNSIYHADPNNPKTWTEYLERGEFPIDTSSYVDDHSNIIVDKIYRYEELGAAMKDIALRTGVPYRPLLVREKSGYRIGVPSFDQVMGNPAERRRIFEAFESSLKFTPYA